MPEPITHSVFAKFMATLAPAMFGALVSLRFLPSEAGIWNRLFSYMCGVLIANYMGGGVVSYFNLKDIVGTSVIFTLGVFGLTMVSHLWIELPKTIAAARLKWIGPDDKGSQ